MSVRIWRDEGKVDGRGFASELPSRWSSVRAVKDEMVEGMVPEREVEEKSLYA